MKARSIVHALTLGLAGAAFAVPAQAQDGFPHDEHAGLFPLCSGCHEGIPQGDLASSYPPAALCARCHDGEQADVVSWQASPIHSGLRFSHPEHEAQLEEGDALACVGCHTTEAAPRMTGVILASQTTCVGCHAHETSDHMAVGSCEQCHLPLAETDWSERRIAALPVPADHTPEEAFLAATHGTESADQIERCATCHTQDRCVACHVNAIRVAEIQALPVAPAGMNLPPAGAEYPTPASHTAAEFLENHVPAEGGTECSTCHVQSDCSSCHMDVGDAPFTALFASAEVQAPGVGVHATTPASHDSPFFMTEHPIGASTTEALCATCHTQPFCNACHEDALRPEFHEVDFVQRHAADAYGRNLDCSNCHSAEVFCRSCHVESGLGSSGRLTVGYHDAEPVWLLRHGQAARQSLESCQSCHTQPECLQCHSQSGAFQANPHGPDFDAQRVQERNPAICFACHLTDPLGGR